ncbi:phage late control D family protein [Helicovermis profundi]|uniref:YqbQ/XkdQ domain-containing protein n=1 Tax=Helicovermis profundi TaxID=3065157 RepID=A0AAU9ENX9_9FIRM|nr:hypothetical protein HLPR_13620 [Clostridia bacterium S502]
MTAFKIDKTKYDFMKLLKKYGDMGAPAFKVLIDGTDIVLKEYMAITKITVETNIDKADFVQFIVSNAYEVDKSSFKWTDKYFLPGKKVEIKLGYVDKFETVFIGVITSATFSIGENSTPNIIVGCMDKSFLMMKGKKYKLWTKMSYSEVVSKIAGNYKLTANVDKTELKYETIIQNFQTDYEFIMGLSKRSIREFFVSGDYLYFIDKYSSSASIITLGIGTDLVEFEYTMDIGEQLTSVEVNGYNNNKEVLKYVAKDIKKIGSGKNTGISLLKKIDSGNASYILSDYVTTKKEAETFAKSILYNQSMKFISSHAKLLGIPELRAGRYIKVEGMWNAKEVLFYIKSCTHEFDYDGYVTLLDMEGNSI